MYRYCIIEMYVITHKFTIYIIVIYSANSKMFLIVTLVLPYFIFYLGLNKNSSSRQLFKIFKSKSLREPFQRFETLNISGIFAKNAFLQYIFYVCQRVCSCFAVEMIIAILKCFLIVLILFCTKISTCKKVRSKSLQQLFLDIAL